MTTFHKINVRCSGWHGTPSSHSIYSLIDKTSVKLNFRHWWLRLAWLYLNTSTWRYMGRGKHPWKSFPGQIPIWSLSNKEESKSQRKWDTISKVFLKTLWKRPSMQRLHICWIDRTQDSMVSVMMVRWTCIFTWSLSRYADITGHNQHKI